MADDEEDEMWVGSQEGTQEDNFRTKSNSCSTLEKLISQAQASDTQIREEF